MRIWILCEDRMHEQLLKAWCKRRGLEVTRTLLPARGRGDASAWVRRQYPEVLKGLRAMARSQSLGLLVMTDGDSAEKRQLAVQVRGSHGAPARKSDEPAAFLIATWSIETWILFLHEGTVVAEDQPSKQRTELHPLLAHPERGTLTSPAVQRVVDRLQEQKTSPDLPSLLDAYAELGRLI